MISRGRFLCAALLIGPLSAAQATPAAVDPAALAAMRRMGAFLRSQRSFLVQVSASTDDVLPSGQKVKRQGSAELRVRRPDRLRADVSTDRNRQAMFYDGNSFTVHDRATNYYATFKAPPTIAGTVDLAETKYGIEFPVADLFTWGTERDRSADVKAAADLGESVVNGTPCRHYAFRQSDVDWQVWIQDGDRPFPRRLVITTVDQPSAPEHDVTMDWTSPAQFDDRVFAFDAPPGAARIDFRPAAPLAGSPRAPSPEPAGGTP